MNIAEFAIKKNVITMVMTVFVVIAGIVAYGNLSRLEDPEFTLKNATIMTPYPGASAAEVEEEVTNVIEKAVQELGQLDFVESTSTRGMSNVKVTIKDQYDKNKLPQVWDELRRKVQNYQVQLPPGSGPSLVNDDFGDVYGAYIAITGEGYTYKELQDFVDLLKRELLLATDVKKIIDYGRQPEVIYVEMNRQKMAQLGISQEDIYNSLGAKNLPADAGKITIGTEFIPINPTGEFVSEKQFGDLLISAKSSDKLIYLNDVATITRGYKEPPDKILRYDGKPAVGLGISTVLGGNVVVMGESINQKLKELEPQAPLGMELEVISLQSDSVVKSIDSFIDNLVAAVLIVVVVLLIFMGVRCGLIIGFILFLTICGTFIFMDMFHVTLERISLGALFIALGMLVDNAIVVTEGMMIKIKQGEDRLKAAKEVVAQTGTPLLGATIVAILAFAAIGTSDDSTGEYCRTLYQVILISLSLSWVTAVTVTPLLGKMFLKGKDPKKDISKADADPYAGGIFRLYKKGLETSIKYRWVTLAVTAGLFILSIYGFNFIKNSFFPVSTRPQFYIDFWMPEGTHIRDTEKALVQAEKYLMDLEGVDHVTSAIGGGEIRFILVYAPETPSTSYGQILINVDDYERIKTMAPQAQKDLEALLPDVTVNVRKFPLGPGEGGKIQVRISGPDHEELRLLAKKAENVIIADGGAQGMRLDWREKIKVVRPQLLEAQARKAGITRPDLAKEMKSSFLGIKTGVYREEDYLIDIVARAPEDERLNVDNLNNLTIWSSVAQKAIPIKQVVSEYKTEYEDATIARRNRKTTITIHTDMRSGLSSELLARIKPKIEKALNVDVGQVLGKTFGPNEDPFKKFTDKTLPIVFNREMPLKGMPGYSLGWGGENEDSAKATAALSGSIPIFAVLMILIVIFLFNALRQPLIIWLCVPLALIGVSAGLLLFDQPFGFMSLLGLLSLSGMLIKNAIVLIDQIDLEIKSGKDHYQAIIDSGVSRMRPVMMAALTTILGMAPLLRDAFFVSMAVTIMFGLGFATILTLIVVPVLYSVFFKVPNKKDGE